MYKFGQEIIPVLSGTTWPVQVAQYDRYIQFKKLMLDYLRENGKHINKYKEKILCCSDVIESTFGKYKNELSKNPMCGITDLVLIIPEFNDNLKK